MGKRPVLSKEKTQTNIMYNILKINITKYSDSLNQLRNEIV